MAENNQSVNEAKNSQLSTTELESHSVESVADQTAAKIVSVLNTQYPNVDWPFKTISALIQDAYGSLRAENTKLVEALKDMRKPPMILESDNACDVASWFVEKIDTALALVTEQK